MADQRDPDGNGACGDVLEEVVATRIALGEIRGAHDVQLSRFQRAPVGRMHPTLDLASRCLCLEPAASQQCREKQNGHTFSALRVPHAFTPGLREASPSYPRRRSLKGRKWDEQDAGPFANRRLNELNERVGY